MSKIEIEKYATFVFWSTNDDAYVATCSEFPWISGISENKLQAVCDLHTAIEMVIEVMEEDGQTIPRPTLFHNIQHRDKKMTSKSGNSRDEEEWDIYSEKHCKGVRITYKNNILYSNMHRTTIENTWAGLQALSLILNIPYAELQIEPFARLSKEGQLTIEAYTSW